MKPNIFLTEKEKENLKVWKYSVEDNSILSELCDNFWNWAETLVPNTVSPNILSLVGLICQIFAFQLCYAYLEYYPNFIAVIACILFACYATLDSIDGKHARKIGMSGPLGELFDHACDNVGTSFMTLSMCLILNITNPCIQWYLVQSSQLVFLLSHIEAFKTGVVRFSKYSGPVEILGACISLVLIKVILGINLILPTEFGYCVSLGIYYAVLAYVIYQVCLIKSYSTRYGMLISLGVRLIPSILIYLGAMADSLDSLVVLNNGIIMGLLTSEIIVAKMSKRDLSQYVPVLIMLSVLGITYDYGCLIICCLYYSALLYEISTYLGMPLFDVVHNVYVNGVFDLMHEGHLNLFERAVAHGNRLYVGVLSDKSVESYKRQPTQTLEERVSAVRKAKYVHEVIPDCEMCITEDFLKQYKIHTVCAGDEYNSPDDKYYEVPRKLGILKILPRTESVSTTDLRNRLIKKKE